MAVPSIKDIQLQMSNDQVFLVYSNQLYSKTLTILITKDYIYCQLADNFQYINEVLGVEHFIDHLKENIDSLDFYKIQEQIKSKNRVIHFYSEMILKEFIAYYRKLLQIPMPNSQEVRQAKEIGNSLYRFLIGDLGIQLNTKKKIIIVPDAYIGLIPFETLITEKSNYLVEEFDISYIQSVTIWDYLQKRKYQDDRKEILAFGDVEYEFGSGTNKRSTSVSLNEIENGEYANNLDSFENLLKNYNFRNIPGSRKELEYISDIFEEPTIIKGSKATEHRIRDLSVSGNLQDFKVIHFSTHGVFVSGYPSLTSLVFSRINDKKEDGFLNLNEIADLKMEADFVNLSACETGIGDTYSGEGIVGIAQAFTIAGANGMAVSMWQVGDESTALFMKRIYEKVEKEGKGFIEAMNLVKRDYINGKYSDFNSCPSSWASFYYYGK